MHKLVEEHFLDGPSALPGIIFIAIKLLNPFEVRQGEMQVIVALGSLV